MLVVSQFHPGGLGAEGEPPVLRRGPDPARAEALYLRVASALAEAGLPVETGRFAADMRVVLENDGPVTFVVDVRGGRVVEGAAP